MTAPWVCERCSKVCDVFDRIERRIEFREPRHQARYATYIESRICRGCAQKEIEEKRPKSQQGTFL